MSSERVHEHGDEQDELSDFVVRLATVDDIEAAALTGAAAFLDSNWMEETIQKENRYERLVELNKIFFSEVVVPSGFMWIAEDTSADEARHVLAYSAWGYPQDVPGNPAMILGDMRERIAEFAGDKADAFFEFEEWLDPYQPEKPGYYLGSLAVSPDQRGKGLASAVLEPGFKQAKDEGYPIYLDTSTSKNKAMYEHFGFHETHEVEMPHGAFISWLMEKPA